MRGNGDIHAHLQIQVKLKPIDFWMLLIAGLFILAGLICLIHPEPMPMSIPTSDPYGLNNQTYQQMVSKTGMHIYAGLALALGAGIAWFFWPRRPE